jgi:plastocyanin
MKRVLIVGLLLLGAAACGGGDADGSNLSSGEGDEADGADLTLPEEVVDVTGDPAEVVALDNTFDAEGIRVAAGTTVRWVNNGRQDHDVVAVQGDWGAEVDEFHPGDAYEHTFAEPGTYNYYCTIHGTADRGMVGVVVVE